MTARRDFDFYPTPDDAILPYLAAHPLTAGKVLDLCAGTGNIGKALHAADPSLWIDAVEIQPRFVGELVECGAYQIVQTGNVLTMNRARLRGYDVIISNPPFADAVEMARIALACAQRVIFLLRSAFTASEERVRFWRDAPKCRISFLPNRPSFTGNDATGQYDYAWFDWNQAMTENTFDLLPSRRELRGREQGHLL